MRPFLAKHLLFPVILTNAFYCHAITLYDKLENSTHLVCKANRLRLTERTLGDKESRITKDSKDAKGAKKLKPIEMRFVINRYSAGIFSDRKFGKDFYTVTHLNPDGSRAASFNVWPDKTFKFSKIISIDNGYKAERRENNKLIHLNEEFITIDDYKIEATFWDTAHSKTLPQGWLKDYQPSDLPVQVQTLFRVNLSTSEFVLHKWKRTNADKDFPGSIGQHFQGTCKTIDGIRLQ